MFENRISFLFTLLMWHIIIIQSPAVKQELFSPKHFRYLHKNEDSMKRVCRNYHKRFSDSEHGTRTLLLVPCTFHLLSIARAQDSFCRGCLFTSHPGVLPSLRQQKTGTRQHSPYSVYRYILCAPFLYTYSELFKKPVLFSILWFHK